MPGQFEGIGIALLYPENWNLEQEDDDSVTLESPLGSFLTITRLAATTTPQAAMERARLTMEEEYEAVENEPLDRALDGVPIRGMTQRFVYLDLIITAQLLILEHQRGTFLIQIQGEDRDIDQQQLVFDAILTSMCQHLNRAG